MSRVLDNAASVGLAPAEAALTIGVLATLILAIVKPHRSERLAAGVTIASCVAACGLAAVTRVAPVGLFGGLMARDPFSDFFRVLVPLATALVTVLATGSRELARPDDGERRMADAPELHALLLAAALGSVLMASATHALSAYLAIELTSLASYVLAGYAPGSRRAAEASLKYVVYGGVASGALLYGLSLLYGAAGSLHLADLRAAIAAGTSPVVIAGVALVLAGVGWKLAVAPFHMWCPDVYEGAPTPVTAFLSIAPKAAGFALCARLVGSNGAAGAGRSPWLFVLLAVAVLTLVLGNLAALWQRNVKRLLAYSSIGHAGFLLLAVAAGAPRGHEALLVYLGVYVCMNIVAFGVVIALGASGVGETLDDFAGLGARAPVPALMLAIALFALAGLPPTAGFIAKYYVFAAVIERGLGAGGGPFLAAAGASVLMTVVSFAYYARILRAMYLVRREGPAVSVAPAHLAVLVLATVPIVVLGVYWTPLADVAAAALALWR